MSETVELPELDVTDKDRERAKRYCCARFGSAVVTEAFTFEDAIRAAYHDEILAVAREKSGTYNRERQLLAAIARAELAEAKLEAEAWRAIETHPLDNAPVIIFCERYGQVEAWFAAAEGQGEDRYGPFWIVCDDAVELEVEETPNGLDHHNVTHWKPLSPKPAVE